MDKKNMRAFSKTEVNELLSVKLRSWSFDGKYISRSFKFKTFVNAFSFMTAVALEAEKMDHHPEWSNVYNSVTINLNTHDANGITRLDSDLALLIDKVFGSYMHTS
jgi:4a-hydroxytetrahydrobiopterin dehydratase